MLQAAACLVKFQMSLQERLSFNVSGLTINQDKSEIRIDLRIPVLADKDKLVRELSQIAEKYQLRYEEFDYLAPLYVPLDSELVSTLMAVYKEKTNDDSPAVSSGGATFARTMPSAWPLAHFSLVLCKQNIKRMTNCDWGFV